MFFIIALLGITGLMCTDLFVPSLPAIAAIFHQTQSHAELTISLFLMSFAISQLFYGPLSDRIGRKMPMLIGVLIFTVGSLMCAMTSSFEVLCMGRIIQGIGVGGGLSLARVIIRDCYQGTRLAVKSSQLAIMVSLTPAIAPFVGGILQSHFGFRSTFIFMLCYGLFLLCLVFFFKETIKEKNATLTVQKTIGHYVSLLKNITFMRYVLITGLGFSAIILSANVMPFIIQTDLHLSATVNGEMLLLSAIGISIGAFISSKVVHRYTPQKLIRIGLFALTLSGLCMVFSQYYVGTTLLCLVPLIFIIMMACGLIFPNALTACFSQVSINIGIAGAVYGSVQMFTSMVINFILNTIPHQGQTTMGLFYVIMGLCGLFLYYYQRRHHQRVALEVLS